MTDRVATARPLILASGSSARRRLLQQAGVEHEVHVPTVEESAIKQAARHRGASAKDCAYALAVAKARAISDTLADAHVIAADQLLVLDDEWFDKPADLHDARAQLRGLSGRTHHLVTAAVCRVGGSIVWSHVSAPTVTMRTLSDALIDEAIRIEGSALLSCVGAYRIEGFGARLFSSIDGDIFTIQGLPLLPLLGHLIDAGLVPG